MLAFWGGVSADLRTKSFACALKTFFQCSGKIGAAQAEPDGASFSSFRRSGLQPLKKTAYPFGL
jgi:hypothetical protein